MIFAEDSLIASKSPRVYGPGLVRLVLAGEEEAEVVGCIERWDIGCDVSRTECLLLETITGLASVGATVSDIRPSARQDSSRYNVRIRHGTVSGSVISFDRLSPWCA